MYATGVAEYLGLHPTYYDETNAGGASFEVLAEHAAYAIESGAAEVVLITYGSIQLSQMGRRLGTGGGGGAGFAPGPAIYDALWGNTLVGSLRAGRPAPHAPVRDDPRAVGLGGRDHADARGHATPRPRSASPSRWRTSSTPGWWPTPSTSSTAASSPTGAGPA